MNLIISEGVNLQTCFCTIISAPRYGGYYGKDLCNSIVSSPSLSDALIGESSAASIILEMF